MILFRQLLYRQGIERVNLPSKHLLKRKIDKFPLHPLFKTETKYNWSSFCTTNFIFDSVFNINFNLHLIFP